MTLRLTERNLAKAYEYLRATNPFDGWGLPPSSKIKFQVIKDPTVHADFNVISGKPVIRVSENGVGHTITLMASVAHEIVHLRQWMTKKRDTHGKSFKAMRAEICESHGFDPNTF